MPGSGHPPSRSASLPREALGIEVDRVEELSGEHASYLWVAETVLRRHGRPLTARQIVTFGLDDGLFAEKDMSRTPQKSMQARLSMDIVKRGGGSRFLRTGPGKFFLRELLETTKVGANDEGGLKEYTAPRRTPSAPSEQVLVAPADAYSGILGFQGINTNYEDLLSRLKSTGKLTHIPRTDAETSPHFKQFVTYTFIQQRDRILSFRRGQYNRAASFLRGARCIGFGGHVTEDDLNILTFSDRGIRANAAREISEEIKFSTSRPDIDPGEIEVLGLLNDDSSDVGVRHVAAVLRYWAPETPEWKAPQPGRVVARLLDIPPVPITPRAEFQSKAFSFISQPNGPRRLAEAILEEVVAIGEPRVTIDGVRQIETLEHLRALADRKVAMIFVHTPPDVAYKLYMAREVKVSNLSLSEFMQIYNAPVESEVRLIIQYAEAIIYNWFGLDEYELVVEKLVAELGL